MRYSLAAALAVFLVTASSAQEKLPPRFDPLTKNDRFRLVRVLGMPELPATFTQTSAISADGRWGLYAEDLSSGSDEKPRLRTRLLLWDLQAKTWPREIDVEGKSVLAVDLSRDGSKALLSGHIVDARAKKKEDGLRACLCLFDLKAGKAIRTIDTADKMFQCIALAPDASNALTGAKDKLVQWDLATGKVTATFDPEKANPKIPFLVTALAYLPGGEQFLAGYYGGQTKLFDVSKEKPVRIYGDLGKDEYILFLAASSDGKRFATGEPQMGISVWDITGKKVGMLPRGKNDDLLTSLTLSPDGKTVLATWMKPNPDADDFACSRLVASDGAGKTLWSQTVPYRGQPPVLATNYRFLVGGGPNVFDVWGIKDGKNVRSQGGHKSPVNFIGTLANGDIASAGLEDALMIWHDGQLVRRDPGHTGAVTALAVSKDRKHWLTGGNDFLVRYWSDGKAKELPKVHTATVTSVAFNSDGTLAVSGSGDRTARTWDLKTLKEIATFAGHSEGVNAVAISPDDRWLATGSTDATIRVWPILNGKLDPDRETSILEGHGTAVTCLAFSADGKSLISGSQDQTVKVWDWAKERCTRTISGHKNWITSLLLVDAKTALTTSDDLSICWWDLETGKEIGRFDFGAVGDCPRCITRVGPDRLLVGTSSWLIYELQMLPKTGKGPDSSR